MRRLALLALLPLAACDVKSEPDHMVLLGAVNGHALVVSYHGLIWLLVALVVLVSIASGRK